MADNQNNTSKSNSAPKYIIETLKAKDENKILHYVYPVTLMDAVIDSEGVSIADKLAHSILKVSVPANLWKADGNRYTATISGLELDTKTDYEVTFNTENLSDEIYISLTSCFIVPASYTSTTLVLKALSGQPKYNFDILIIKR